MDRKKVLLQAIESGFEVTSEGIPCETEYAKEGNALDYVIEGNDGGVGDKTKNLIVYPYYNTTKTVRGITFTDNGDGSITVDGTATGTIVYHILISDVDNASEIELLPTKKYYFSDNCDDSSSPCRFVIQLLKRDANGTLKTLLTHNSGILDVTGLIFDEIWVAIIIHSGDIFNNVTFKPQLELGETATEYELYGYKIPLVNHENGNLFNYTEPKNDNQVKADKDGWFDITIDNSAGTSTVYKNCWTNINPVLKPDTRYYLYTEIAEQSGDISYAPCSTSSGSSSQFKWGLMNTPAGYITTTSDFTSATSMLRTFCGCAAGKSGHIKFRIAVYETKQDTFTPYAIPQTTEILLDAPLMSGESIRYTSDNLPALPLHEDGNTITVGTTVQPSKLAVTYRAKVK